MGRPAAYNAQPPLSPYTDRQDAEEDAADAADRESDSQSAPLTGIGIPRTLEALLYTSHFLSMWNSRLFEFAAVLFLASIYPSSLLPMSVYALVRSATAMAISPSLGAWIDSGDRLNVVRVSILGQRVAVAASCGIFWALEWKDDFSPKTQDGLFAAVVLLACIEKLCAVMNIVAVERDWVRCLFLLSGPRDRGRDTDIT